MSRAVFLGSFDPPHIGHRNVIETIVNSDIIKRCNIDMIHIIPTYQNPNKQKSTPFIDRYNMCIKMFSGIDNVVVDDIEQIVKPQYTFDLFKRFHSNEDKMIKPDFWWIITSETINELINGEWYKSITMLCENKFIVVVKNDDEIISIKKEINWNKGQINFIKIDNIYNIHSTLIRNMIKSNDNINQYVNNDVNEYILEHKLYIK